MTGASTRDARSAQGRIVLAYPGGAASTGALKQWLATGREIVTVTIDLGQESDLDQVREQALSVGALRAHVLDAREEFARDYLLPALRTQPLHALDPHALAAPLVARKLAEIAAIEHADVVMDADGAGRTLIERQVCDGERVRGLPARVDLEIQAALPVTSSSKSARSKPKEMPKSNAAGSGAVSKRPDQSVTCNSPVAESRREREMR